MEKTLIDSQSMAKERGDSLEMAIEHLFKVANFQTERNVLIAKYEIDVLAKVGDRNIVIECKNYQNSNLTIRNLIHQWHSKNQIIGAHKVILVLAGLNVKESDRSLASEFDMEIWNQEDLTELFNLSLKPDELRERLFQKISLSPLKISERYRDDLTYLVIVPYLTRSSIDDELLYWKFNKWLRAHIITELQMVETSPANRLKHIELFEGSKTTKGFLNISRKRKQVDYWNTVYHALEHEDILTRDQQRTYLSYMNDLLAEYNAQQEFFKSGEYFKRIRKLISSRLQNAIYHNENCRFKAGKVQNMIKVDLLDTGSFRIHITDISAGQGNILNWILTSQYHRHVDETGKIENFYWLTSTFNETSEKVFRVLTEYIDIQEGDPIIDTSISLSPNR